MTTYFWEHAYGIFPNQVQLIVQTVPQEKRISQKFLCQKKYVHLGSSTNSDLISIDIVWFNSFYWTGNWFCFSFCVSLQKTDKNKIMENKRSIKYKKVATFLFANFLLNSTSFIAEGRNDNKITAAVNLSMNSFSLINCGIKTFLTFPFQIKLKFNFRHTSY